jgi:hypothetical protein
MTRPKPEFEVLDYSVGGRSQSTVRRTYLRWRTTQGLPLRCDNDKCNLHQPAPQWNGQPLSLTLDHIDGNRANNRHANLRLLCANCDSQLPTRGGKNKGRIHNATEDSYHVVERDGSHHVKKFFTRISGGGRVRAVGMKGGRKSKREVLKSHIASEDGEQPCGRIRQAAPPAGVTRSRAAGRVADAEGNALTSTIHPDAPAPPRKTPAPIR